MALARPCLPDGLPNQSPQTRPREQPGAPLYYQFAAEHRGGFHGEYLERGPQSWRVRIRKGNYAELGFVSGERVRAKQETPPTATPQPLVLDLRPLFAQGASPCSAIGGAVASLLASAWEVHGWH